MKVQLERRLSFCPSKLECVVCREKFEPQLIRSYLCNDQGLIQGDCCPNCLSLGSQYILEKLIEQTKKIREKLDSLFLESLAENNVSLPKSSQWFSKWLEIFIQESCELNAAKMGFRQRSKFTIFFEQD
ncbi:MAG: hypothetical protein WCO81_10720 [Cyanobacteriota bacterium ELA615]